MAGSTPPNLFGRIRFFPHHPLDRPSLTVSYSERAPFLAAPDAASIDHPVIPRFDPLSLIPSLFPAFPATLNPPQSVQSHASRFHNIVEHAAEHVPYQHQIALVHSCLYL